LYSKDIRPRKGSLKEHGIAMHCWHCCLEFGLATGGIMHKKHPEVPATNGCAGPAGPGAMGMIGQPGRDGGADHVVIAVIDCGCQLDLPGWM